MYFNQYCIALQQFRTEYGKYPTIFEERDSINLAEPGMSQKFMEALSGRTLDGKVVRDTGNRHAVAFLSFSDIEYRLDKNGVPQLYDAYGNPNIVIVVDNDDDGVIRYTVDGQEHEVRAQVIAYTLATEDFPAVTMD